MTCSCAIALAGAYDAAQQSLDADWCLQDAFRLAPMYMEPRLSIALHYHRQGRFAEAERAYLWSKEATAGSSEEWLRLYQQLLQDALRIIAGVP